MQVTSEKFQSILTANQILSSTLDLSELLRKIMNLATSVVGAETSSILLYDETTNELVFNIALTEKESELKEIRLKGDEGIAGWVVREKKVKIVNDMKNDPNWAKRTDDKIDFQTRSILAVPLLFQGKLLGVVEAVNKKEGVFTDEDTEVLEAFAAQAAVSISNAKLFGSLQEEKGKIEAVFSQMSDGAIFVDTKGNVILSNKEAEKLLGQEHISKKNVSDMFSEFESNVPISDLIQTKEIFVPVELTRSKGKTLFLSGVVSRISSQEGEVLGYIFIFRDITLERKETMLKRNFLSLVSHKLKTPLVTITGYGPLLLDSTDLNEMQRKAITSIYRQGLHLSTLVDKLLYFTMVESEELTIKKEKLTFKMLTESSLSALRSFIEDKSAVVEIDANVEKLDAIHMDGTNIEAVIRNLIENAIKFNTGESKKVRIYALEENGLSGIVVEDNGPGIPPEEREKIFQKFYQIEESFTGQVEGVGLGLTLVKQVVESHGGKVGLESSIGKGSKFNFVLPK